MTSSVTPKKCTVVERDKCGAIVASCINGYGCCNNNPIEPLILNANVGINGSFITAPVPFTTAGFVTNLTSSVLTAANLVDLRLGFTVPEASLRTTLVVGSIPQQWAPTSVIPLTISANPFSQMLGPTNPSDYTFAALMSTTGEVTTFVDYSGTGDVGDVIVAVHGVWLSGAPLICQTKKPKKCCCKCDCGSGCGNNNDCGCGSTNGYGYYSSGCGCGKKKSCGCS